MTVSTDKIDKNGTPPSGPFTHTPIRDLGTRSEAGYQLLRDVGSTYRDGGESDVLRIISEATDHSSHSDEMITAAVGWAQRYHLHPARTNIVRCLDLPPTARVLEIGAGCGAVTRYLGETCAIVDALEPVPARAAAAAARTADLDNVTVFVGELADVPDVAAYDVVVVIGVLEYVGRGTSDLTPYLNFLSGIESRLVPGGTLVLAIENRLGVKYLVGAPEDHSNRVFDSIDGYPVGANARTFSRAELESMMVSSGLLPKTRIAFPDYKITRAVLGEFPVAARSLLHRVPRFPSPDWRSARPKLADEHSVWRNLVDAGLAQDFGNSFLVLAGKGTASDLWPEGRAGVFYSMGRRAHLSTETDIDDLPSGVVFRRRAIAPEAGHDRGLHLVESVMPYCAGVDLTAVVAERGVLPSAPLFAQWLQLLDAEVSAADQIPIDLVPHNLVFGDDGELHVIDIELLDSETSRDLVVRRGVFWLAHRAVRLAPPNRWAPCATVGEVMAAIGTLVGLPADGSWIEQVVIDEAALQTRSRYGPPAALDQAGWRARIEDELRKIVKTRLVTMPLGERLPEQHRRVVESHKAARAEIAILRAELAARTKQLARAEATLKSSRSIRASRRLRRVAARALPRGTRRRAVVSRVVR